MGQAQGGMSSLVLMISSRKPHPPKLYISNYTTMGKCSGVKQTIVFCLNMNNHSVLANQALAP